MLLLHYDTIYVIFFVRLEKIGSILIKRSCFALNSSKQSFAPSSFFIIVVVVEKAKVNPIEVIVTTWKKAIQISDCVVVFVVVVVVLF